MSRTPRTRTGAALLVGAAIATSLAAVPVGAHVTRGVKHTVKHLAKVFYTKAQADERFLTPAQGDSRYLDQAEGDARYLAATGDIRLNASPMTWVKLSAAHSIPTVPSAGATTFGGSSTSLENLPIGIAPTIPTMIMGQQVALVAVEACYSTDAITTIDIARIQVTSNVSGAGSTSTVLTDITDRGPNESACRTYTPSQPVTIAPQDDVSFQFDVDYSANAGNFHAGRATFIIRVL